VPVADSTAVAETVFRMEFPRVVATLARVTNDLDLAEDLAQEALVDALRQWARDGVPSNPGAWLTAVGKRKAIDRFRRDRTLADKYAQLGRALEPEAARAAEQPNLDEEALDDDRLRLIFVACHPLVPLASRIALTLRLVGGLTTAEIARAYVVGEPTIAQRIVRAKRAIARAGIPFEVPEGQERTVRLGSVLEVIYLIFNEGYSATNGAAWLRPELCSEAVRLGRVLAGVAPGDAEVHGLVALMELNASRLRARVGPGGAVVVLADQDRRSWDQLLIARGEAALRVADGLSPARGRYALQAAIAACHARAFRPEETDWAEIVALYGELASAMPSPVVELNRAVAISMASGPAAGLALVDQLVDLGVLDRYHLLHAVRGDLLARLGRHAEAAPAFERGAELVHNLPERELLQRRAAESSERATTDASGG
jgi:RNA polymerase sigma factor (sigma-70 family)